MHPGRPPSLARARTLRSSSILLAFTLAALIGCQGDIESRLAEIRSLQEAGEFEASIEPLRGLVTTNSSHPEVNFRLGVALVRTGRPSLAIWPLQKAADSEEHGLASGILLISALLNTQDYEEAVRAADRILASEPDNKMALYGRGQANISAAQAEASLADADHLLGLDPTDTRALILKSAALAELDRLDEAEAAQRELEKIAGDAGDASQAARACAARGVLYQKTERPEEAGRTFLECVERYPSDAIVRSQATDHFVEQRAFSVPVDMWRSAVEEAPEDGALRVRLAELLRQDGRQDEAEAVLSEMVELFDSAAAWRAMATFRRNSGQVTPAREALEQAIERTPGDAASLRFELAELLIEEGDLDRARETASELSEPAYTHLLRGAIALEEDDPKAALEAFESGLRRWPNNAGARYMAGVAAERIGDLPRAMAEYREAVRNDPARSDAALRLAQLHFERAEYPAALDFAETHINTRPFTGPAAHILAARAATAGGDHPHSEKLLNQLLREPGQEVTAIVELVEAAKQASGPEAAIRTLEQASAAFPEAGADPDVQRALVGLLAEAGRASDALARARARVAQSPNDAAAHDLLGRVLLRQSRIDDAAAEFERAVKLDATAAAPLEGLGFVALARGDYPSAVGRFEQAAKLDPATGEYSYRAAQAELASGDRAGAMARLHATIEVEPAHAAACNDLAWLLAETGGDLELALELARRAVRASPGGATRDTLGWVHLKRGDADLAEQSFATVIRSEGESPLLLYHLGLSLARQGKKEDAQDALRKAVAADAFPEAAAARAELDRLETL